MSERTITSPIGDDILILDDQSFGELAGLGGKRPQSLTNSLVLTPARVGAIASLFYDGPAEHKSGTAALVLEQRARRYGLPNSTAPGTVTDFLQAPLARVAVEREVRGRRTYRIRLVALPEGWYKAVEQLAAPPAAVTGDVDGGAPSTPPAPVEQPDAQQLADAFEQAIAPAVEPEPVVDRPTADAVATALLAKVVDIMATGGADGPELNRLRGEVDELARRLGSQVDYVEGLRRQLRQASDELVAVQMERDGLRQRLRSAEHNLKVATGADARRIIDAEVARQLDRLMRQAPNGAHAKVAAL